MMYKKKNRLFPLKLELIRFDFNLDYVQLELHSSFAVFI